MSKSLITKKKLDSIVSVKTFGVVGDGVADDTAGWLAWIDYCATNKLGFICNETINSKISSKLTFPRVTVTYNGAPKCLPIDLRNVDFSYTGSRTDIVIDIGEAPGASGYFTETDIFLPRLSAYGTVQWPGSLATSDIGVRIRQAIRCRIHENFIYGFTNGIVYSGCAYNTMNGKHISDSKFGLVYTTEGSTADYSFANENTRIGGKIGGSSSSSGLGNAYMIVFTWDKISSYRGHNANRFIAPCLESNGAGTYQMPIWFDGVGGINSFDHVRVEGCKGPVGLFDGGGGSRAYGTTINLDYISYTGQEISVRQVNGAAGNVITGAGSVSDYWNSGDLQKLITSGGAAGVSYLRGKELFFLNNGTPTLADVRRLESVFANAIKMNRNGIQLDSGGYVRLCVAIDSSNIKDFECSYNSLDGFVGRPTFIALDSQGQILSGSATETFANPVSGTMYSNEQYVKAVSYIGDAGQMLTIGTPMYSPSADSSVNKTVRVTVRPEVKTLIFGVVGASTQALVKSISVRSFSSPNLVGEARPLSSGRGSLRVFSLSDEDGLERMATAKPDTAGTFGYYQRGSIVYNRSAASGQPAGWQCSSSGYLAPTWVLSTNYQVPGMLVTNDTGKIYELTTPGTSSSSGGPTGTTSSWDGISDGTAKWRYVGALVTFVSLPNNP